MAGEPASSGRLHCLSKTQTGILSSVGKGQRLRLEFARPKWTLGSMLEERDKLETGHEVEVEMPLGGDESDNRIPGFSFK